MPLFVMILEELVCIAFWARCALHVLCEYKCPNIFNQDRSNGNATSTTKKQIDSTVGADAKVGMATQFIILAMRDSQSPSLQKTLIKLLPGLFQIQVCKKLQFWAKSFV